MKKIIRRFAMVAVAGLSVGEVWGRGISPDEARTAVSNWLQTSRISRSALPGRNIGTMEKRGGIWLVRLEPSGYVIMSSSDEAAPIVAFSAGPFVEPEPDSAFYVVLHGAETGHARLSEDAAASVNTGAVRTARSVRSPSADGRAMHRKSRWEALLGTKSVTTDDGPKKAADVSTPRGVVTEPFIETHWNQWQPYNDFAPVYASNEGGYYRGRCPCGCVATAAAQAFAYWKWPAYADVDGTRTGKFTDQKGSRIDWPMRFSGQVPMQWTGLPTNGIEQTNWKQGYDLRGTVAEAERYPLARLFFLSDALAKIQFKSGGSSGSFSSVAYDSPWYESARWVSCSDDFDAAVAALKADVVSRMPVQVTVPNHAVVGCGWAEEEGDSYIYLNYGWSGKNDGYYNLDDPYSAWPVQGAYVGFKPRRMVQADPIPGVVGDSVRIGWRIPECYRASTTGFSITAERRQTTPSALEDEFATLSGKAVGAGISLTTDAEQNDGNSALKFAVAWQDSSYELPVIGLLSSRSILSFEVFSFAMLNHNLRVEVNLDGDWTSVMHVPLSDYDENQSKQRIEVPLGEHGGKTARFRIVCDYQGGSAYNSGYALVDNFRVSDVFAYATERTVQADGLASQVDIGGLVPGSDYLFRVKSNEMALDDAVVLSTKTAGDAEVPVPVDVTYETCDLVYGEAESASRWMVSGTVVSSAEIATAAWTGGFSVDLPGPVDANTRLVFGWTASGYYSGSSFDRISVIFRGTDGNAVNVWEVENRSDVDTVRNVDLPLAELSGRRGVLSVRFQHSGSQYSGTKYGARFYGPKLLQTKRQVMDSEIKMAKTTFVRSEDVSILSVESGNGKSSEGFFVECALGVNILRVRCSPSVKELKALPSHLALVSDDHVSVISKGNGEFVVVVNGQDVTVARSRSRMILTLVACDGNGTRASKDLVLRFSSEQSPCVCGFVRFLPDGGSGSMPDMVCLDKVVSNLPKANFTKAGKRFAGWACSNGRRYDDGMLVFNLAQPGETVTMTAIWE